MRRTMPANARGGRAGCVGALLGLIGGVALAYFAYLATKADWVIPVVSLAGMYLGARLSQVVMARAQRGQHAPHGQRPHKSPKRHR